MPTAPPPPEAAAGVTPVTRLARPEVVVAVLEPEMLDPVGEGVARHLLAGPERIARALADQGRRGRATRCAGAQLRPALPRRMERVAEAEQPGDPALACSSSATMLATRPPIDLPPMISGPDAPSAADRGDNSGITVSARGGGRARRRCGGPPCSRTRTGPPGGRRPPAPCAAAVIAAESIGAPAPWASSSVTARRRGRRRGSSVMSPAPFRPGASIVDIAGCRAPPCGPVGILGRARDSAPTSAAPRRGCPRRIRAWRGCRPRRRSRGRARWRARDAAGRRGAGPASRFEQRGEVEPGLDEAGIELDGERVGGGASAARPAASAGSWRG
jgi:hypothetical protein